MADSTWLKLSGQVPMTKPESVQTYGTIYEAIDAAIATELLSLLDYTESRAESPADVAAVIRQRVGELQR